jgi:two-component system sensor kinase FixL
MSQLDNSILNKMLPSNSGCQETINDANARLNALLDAAVDGLIIIDEKGNIELFNSAAQKMFMYSSEQVFK